MLPKRAFTLTAAAVGTAALLHTGNAAAAVESTTETSITGSGRVVTRTVTEPKTVEGERLCADSRPDLTAGQRNVARVIWDAADEHDASVRARVVAFAAALQESRMRDLDGGHADSVGVFQMRPSFPDQWGTAAELDDPEYQANRFFEVLLNLDGWDGRPVTGAAQGVLRSAYPDAYADHVDEAAEVVGWLSETECGKQVEVTRTARFS